MPFSVISLLLEKRTPELSNDNYCFFNLLNLLTLQFQGNERIEEETSGMFDAYLKNTEDPDAIKHQGVFLIVFLTV